jgi:hypothetical protein
VRSNSTSNCLPRSTADFAPESEHRTPVRCISMSLPASVLPPEMPLVRACTGVCLFVPGRARVFVRRLP